MTDQQSSPRKKAFSLKQMRKRERKLNERLRRIHEKYDAAQSRVQRAEERLQKRRARLFKLETRLAQLVPTSDVETADISAVPAPEPEARPTPSVKEKRAIVEAVEESVRTTIMQAASLSAVSATEQSTGTILPATGEAVESDASSIEDAAQGEVIKLSQDEVLPVLFEVEEMELSSSPVVDSAEPAQEEVVELAAVDEIEEEEETIETIAAMIIADAAAVAAARAEAQAEASSARTREARTLAQAADVELERVRAALEDGTLNGPQAYGMLLAAEREATRAHAALLDAEVAEERARREAMNAEAEAEIAEGMALSSEARFDDHERLREQYPPSLASGRNGSQLGTNAGAPTEEQKQRDDEDTLELPVIRSTERQPE